MALFRSDVGVSPQYEFCPRDACGDPRGERPWVHLADSIEAMPDHFACSKCGVAWRTGKDSLVLWHSLTDLAGRYAQLETKLEMLEEELSRVQDVVSERLDVDLSGLSVSSEEAIAAVWNTAESFLPAIARSLGREQLGPQARHSLLVLAAAVSAARLRQPELGSWAISTAASYIPDPRFTEFIQLEDVRAGLFRLFEDAYGRALKGQARSLE